MAQIVAKILMKFLDVDALCALVAKAIACILSYASKKGGKAWDTAKDAVAKISIWTSLFMQVYEDDEMSAEEEKLVADAIKQQTSIEKLVDILVEARQKKEDK